MTDLCYHLVATIYVMLQATLEFYKNVLCDALQNQPDLCGIVYSSILVLCICFCMLQTQSLCISECLQYFSNLCSLFFLSNTQESCVSLY
jgi:hypothetical protein